MKKLETLLFAFFLIGITSIANTIKSEVSEFNYYNGYDGRAYIFEEGGVEFSVFADGQFDFSYVGSYNNQQVQFSVNSPNVNISYNAGQNYDLYVQYDDYGAVTQIENIPIYYDNYGRIVQAGSVDIRYNNRRIVRVGGLFINYNYYGHYVGSRGFINVYNQFYVYRPWHAYYIAPFFSSCIVYDYPYRRYYQPIRYSYAYHRQHYNNRHRVAYQNSRRDFYRPGSRSHYKNGRIELNRDYDANRRNTMISESGRRRSTVGNRSVVRNGEVNRNRTGSGTGEKPIGTNGRINRSMSSSSSNRILTSNKPMSTKSNPRTTSQSSSKRARQKVSNAIVSSTNNGQARTSTTSARSSSSENQVGHTNSRDTSSKRGRGL